VEGVYISKRLVKNQGENTHKDNFIRKLLIAIKPEKFSPLQNSKHDGTLIQTGMQQAFPIKHCPI
jgi:hypothetical protein